MTNTQEVVGAEELSSSARVLHGLISAYTEVVLDDYNPDSRSRRAIKFATELDGVVRSMITPPTSAEHRIRSSWASTTRSLSLPSSISRR